jgi:hypothetical protein
MPAIYIWCSILFAVELAKEQIENEAGLTCFRFMLERMNETRMHPALSALRSK